MPQRMPMPLVSEPSEVKTCSTREPGEPRRLPRPAELVAWRGTVSLARVGADDIGTLYAIAGAVPQAWPHFCAGGLPGPGAFAAAIASHSSTLFVIRDDRWGRVGCVDLYDWHAASGTLWLEVAVVRAPGAEEVRQISAELAVERAFVTSGARKVYAAHHGYETPVLSGLACRWHEEARTRAAVLHDDHYWDEIVCAVYRSDWTGGDGGGS